MKIYFVERKDGLIHGSQACLNPPIDDNLRSREVAAKIHGGSPDDWQGRMIEVDLIPDQNIESIAADGKGGYIVSQKPFPAPPSPSIKEQWEAAKQMVDAHQGLEAVNCTFELTLPVLAALARVVSALAIAKTPEAADVKALTGALADLKTLAATFSDPTLSSSLTVPTPLGYIAYQRKQAAALRQAVAGG